MHRTRAALLALVLPLLVPAGPAAAQPAPEPLTPISTSIPQPTAAGLYFRGSGMAVDMQNDAVLVDVDDSIDAMVSQMLSDPGTISYDPGWGLSLAIGYRFGYDGPFSVEFEYAYRSVDSDIYSDAGVQLSSDGSIDAHTIGVNALFDAPDLVGPFGLYAGAGIGLRISTLRVSTLGGSTLGSSEISISGDDFYWQVMGGVQFSIAPRTQLYAGIRWIDLGRISNDDYRVDAEMLNYEVGIRFFF